MTVQAESKSYDLVIIGGGAAGFASLVKYRELVGSDKRIAIITKGPLGGTCVNVGCVPSKYLIEVAKATKYPKIYLERGVDLGSPRIDFKRVMEGLREIIKKLRKEKYEDLLGYYEAEFYPGTARFVSPKTVVVKGRDKEVEISGEHFIIATGSRPSIPRIDGIDSINYYTSDNIWNLDRLPHRILFIGSGAVGLELAQAFARLGSSVDVVEVLDRPLPGVEPEISEALSLILADEGIKFYTKSRVESLKKEGERVRARIIGPRGSVEEEYDAVIITTGRRPNTEDLNLDAAGVEVDSRGFIKVSSDLRTSNPRIYAAGDVAATPKPALLETLAAREGATAAHNIATREKLSIDYESVPVVVFTDPEVAYVGLTEEKLVKAIGACSCRVVGFELTARSRISSMSRGLAKIVIDPRDSTIKGIHVLAPNASEFIIAASIMLRHKYRIEDLIDVVHVFPTSAEVMKMAGQAFMRRVDRMPCCVE